MAGRLRGHTAAGPLRIRTGFPYKALAGHPRYSQIRPQARCGGDIHGRRPIYLHPKDLYSIWTEKIIHTMLFQHRQAFLTVSLPSRPPARVCVNATNARNTLNFSLSVRSNCIHAHLTCALRHVLHFCFVHHMWNNCLPNQYATLATPRLMGLSRLFLPTVRSASEHATGQPSGMDLMVPIYPRALPGILNPEPNRLAFFLATAIVY